MIIFHNASVKLLNVLERLFRLINFNLFYENKYGIKDFASPSFVMNNDKKISIVGLRPIDVFLSFDGLKDQYTLIETPISESPHVELIRLINSGEDISKCDYILREEKGFLDHRNKQLKGKGIIRFHHEKNKLDNKDRLPIVYKIDEKYYVLDGKHRIASSLLSDEKIIQCKEILCKDIIEWKYLCKLYPILKRKKGYSKQLQHIEKLMKVGGQYE